MHGSGIGLERRGPGPDSGLLGRAVYGFGSNPILRSNGQFYGRDFSRDFGHHFDDANLTFVMI